MKKIIIVLLIILAFFIGRITMYQSDYNKMYDSINQIVDWNTDGEELSVFTKDGYEFYAYKTEDIYKNKLFVSIKN